MKAYPWLEYLNTTDPSIQNPVSHGGMDLRDYFAAHAMPELLRWDLALPVEDQNGMDWVGKFSYQIADALMKARKNENN